ncbi:ABC transporter ATP-binding protein [Deinococcus rubellus]
MRAYRLETGFALLSLLAVTAANLYAPQLIRLAVDGGLTKRDWKTVLAAVGGLVAVALVRGLFTFLQGYLSERASQGVAYALRGDLFARTQRLGFSFYDKNQTGQLLTRLTSDVEQIRTFVGSGVIQLIASTVTLLGTATLLLVINWRLALVTLLIIPPIVWLLFTFIGKVGPLFGQVQRALGALNAMLREMLAGTRVVRAFGREDFERERYRQANEQLLGKNLATVRAISNNFPFVALMGNLGTLAVVWYGGLQIFSGSLTLGELIAFNTYVAYLLQPILALGFLAASISRAGASAVRVFEILDAELDVKDAPDARPLPPIEGRLRFENVHFRYAGAEHDVLRGVHFEVQPGQTVAILGTTGSGKSTAVNLIPRFYDPTEGRILIDGHDIRTVTLGSLRPQIGIVLQDALLFSGSIRSNIAYGRPNASDIEVRAAARVAQAATFIEALPQGYDTEIGERGVGLSGGQRQRLAIARALLINPKLLILDDSTSAVDAETESLILDALDKLIHDQRRTTVVIAQRISTVRSADLILVLDGGVIVASGTHEELSETSELYTEIVGSQLRPDRLVLDKKPVLEKERVEDRA